MRKHDRANSRFNLQTANSRYEFTISRRDAPELCMSLRPTEGVGNAGCPLHPQPRAQSVVTHTSVVTTGPPEHPAFPHAMVLRLISCSPRRRIRLVTVIGELTACLSPVGPTCLRQLDTSNGCQDHTALPSAAIVVRLRAVDHSRVFRQPALRSHRAPDAATSTASHPASVTIAIRPSEGRDGGGYRFDLGQVGTEIFLIMGLDSLLTDLPVGQFSE